MGWLIALLIVIVLAVIPLGVSLVYNSEGFKLALLIGPIRIGLIPGKKKASTHEADKPKKKNKEKPASTESNSKKEEPKGGSVKDFFPMVKLGLNFLGDFRRKIRVNKLYLNIILAGGDPCDLAINYGRTWTAVGNLWPGLEAVFKIKKRDVKIQCDFEGAETLVDAQLDVTITLGRLLALVVVYAVRFLKEYLKFKKKRKGGVAT